MNPSGVILRVVAENQDHTLDGRLQLAYERYRDMRPLYRDFAETLKFIMTQELASRAIRVHSVESRAKTGTSFVNKASLLIRKAAAGNRDIDPFKRITDLAGLRIITFFLNTISAIDEVIHSEFFVIEKDDRLDGLNDEGKFGYKSVHYLVKLGPNRTDLSEYSKFKNLVAEIQVRTILQHAWAEIEHDIEYKSLKCMPSEVRRRFESLAALLEIADREFQAIHDQHEALQRKRRGGGYENCTGEAPPDVPGAARHLPP